MSKDIIREYELTNKYDPNIQYKLHITYDECAFSPREWDNSAKVFCWHPDYDIGDPVPGNPQETINMICEEVGVKYNPEARVMDKLNMLMEKCDDIVIKKIRLYDHSGITISTSEDTYPYNDPWDSMNVGIVFITKHMYEKNISPNLKNWREIASKLIDNEIDTLDQYVRGNVYCVELLAKHTLNIEDVNDTIGEVQNYTETKWIQEDYIGEIYDDMWDVDDLKNSCVINNFAIDVNAYDIKQID